MELWIRSQDKTKLVKVDNIAYMDSSEDYEKEVHSLWNDCKGILGTYKSKERALEVLDEIQNILSENCLLKSYDNVTPEFSENIIINPCEVHIEQLNNYVYNMPEN